MNDPHSNCAEAPSTVRADWIFTGTEWIENAVLRLQADSITEVTVTDESVDLHLSGCAVLPRLINAHTHLEFSDLEAPLGPRSEFVQWIESVIQFRQKRSHASPPINEALRRGLQESLEAGVGIIGEIATFDDWPSIEGADLESLHCFRFLELIGLSPERTTEALERAERFLGADDPTYVRGLSPHAPYSTSMELVEGVVQLAQQADAPIAMHLAETRQELEWMSDGTGPFADFLRSRGLNPPARRSVRALDYLELLSAAPRSLIVHGNYLDDSELAKMAECSGHMSLVFCPRTHAYFSHARYPLPRLLEMGVRVAMGTDSRASNPDLDLWAELCWLSHEFPEIDATALLKMATSSGADALGCKVDGRLETGLPANFLVIEMRPSPTMREALFGGRLRQRWHCGRPAAVE